MDKRGWHSMGMSTSPTWLIANWKMNGNAHQMRDWMHAVDIALGQGDSAVQCVLCPPFVYLSDTLDALLKVESTTLAVGAQNCHPAEKGAYTGEISAPMLAELSCKYVIVGHSERRATGETDAEVLAKAQAVIAAKMIPVICVGESRAVYEAGQTKDVLNAQLATLSGLNPAEYLIAYEPIWAIGTGLTPTVVEIQAVHRHIKSVLGSGVSVLYGGSVNAGNLEEILGIAEVSGGLIGGASLEIESMGAMVAIARKIRGN